MKWKLTGSSARGRIRDKANAKYNNPKKVRIPKTISMQYSYNKLKKNLEFVVEYWSFGSNSRTLKICERLAERRVIGVQQTLVHKYELRTDFRFAKPQRMKILNK